MDKTKDGYYRVGKYGLKKMAAKLKPYDLIISADGKDIRNLDLSLQKNDSDIKDFTDFFDNKKKLNLFFKATMRRVKNLIKKLKQKSRSLIILTLLLIFILNLFL